MTLRIAIVVVLLAALAFVGWWQLGPTSMDDVDPVATSEDEMEASIEVGLEGRADARESDESDSVDTMPDEDVVSEGATVSLWKGPRVLIDISVNGIAPDQPQGALVTVRPLTGDWFGRAIDPIQHEGEGIRFQVDVTGMFAVSHGSIVELVVDVDHQSYVRASRHVRVDDDVDLTAKETQRVSLAVDLVPARIIEGRVVFEDEPEEPRYVAAVYRFIDGVPDVDPLDVRSFPRGAPFRLRAPRDVPLLVLAHEAALLPATVELGSGGADDAGTLILREALAIEGRVRVTGYDEAQVAIDAMLDGEEVHYVRAEEHEFAWVDGRAAPAWVYVDSNPDGTYRIAPLAAAEYHVRVSDVTIVGRTELMEDTMGLVHDKVVDLMQLRVTPPATGVDFELDLVPVTLRVHSGGAPLDEVSYFLEGEHSGTGTSTDEGESDVRFFGPKDVDLDVQLDKEGYESVQLVVRVPSTAKAHVQSVEMKPTAPKGRILVRFESREPDVPDESGFLLYRELEDGEREYATSWDRKRQDGVFVLDHVPAGTFFLEARPGVEIGSGVSVWYAARQRVTVEGTGDVLVSFDVRRGGRVRVVVRDSQGRGLEGRVGMHRGQTPIAMSIYQLEEWGWWDSGKPYVGSSGVGYVGPALPAGRYTLVVSHAGFLPARVDVDVVEGKTVDVEVTLEAE